jgi:hypothetical protein
MMNTTRSLKKKFAVSAIGAALAAAAAPALLFIGVATAQAAADSSPTSSDGHSQASHIALNPQPLPPRTLPPHGTLG